LAIRQLGQPCPWQPGQLDNLFSEPSPSPTTRTPKVSNCVQNYAVFASITRGEKNRVDWANRPDEEPTTQSPSAWIHWRLDGVASICFSHKSWKILINVSGPNYRKKKYDFCRFCERLILQPFLVIFLAQAAQKWLWERLHRAPRILARSWEGPGRVLGRSWEGHAVVLAGPALGGHWDGAQCVQQGPGKVTEPTGTEPRNVPIIFRTKRAGLPQATGSVRYLF